MIKLSSNASNRLPWGLILSLALHIFISNLEEVKTASDKSSQMTTRKVVNNEAGSRCSQVPDHTSGNKDYRPISRDKSVYRGEQ